ncbi:ABC transporter permease [Candidatus Formimonas warabiya]|uniref:ABC transmembrane type-2 domain-containing protein n=1 Tax=Formimonas warabiya TaxID=1761012 RepID=A0A3G1KRS3_FORW1|nr:ABC transporter permease [Candidatus Formimonas warabiya]ATW25158.1 hypothetical protein DCMF_10600 [Candidatus Formimonas warabiya]
MRHIIKLRLIRLRDDYLVFILMTAMALGLTFIFGTSMGQYQPRVLIVDEDGSTFSRMLADEIKEGGGFRFQESDYAGAVKAVEEGSVLTALVIEKGFAGDIRTGNKLSLGMIKVKDDINILTLEQQVTGTASKMAGSQRIAEMTADFISTYQGAAGREALAAQAYDRVMDAWKYRNPLTVRAETMEIQDAPQDDNMKHTVIGFSLFFSMYTMVFGIGTILYDKQHKTWQRMLVSPVSRTAILGGSMVAAYLIGAIQLGVLILAGKYLFGMDWGRSLAGVLTVSAAFVFAVTSLGLFLSGLVKTHAQLSALTPVVLTSTAMLGGCMWPLEIVNSKILLVLANLTPQKWAIQGMERIASYGQGFDAAILPTLVLLAMGLGYFIAGVKLIGREKSLN